MHSINTAMPVYFSAARKKPAGTPEKISGSTGMPERALPEPTFQTGMIQRAYAAPAIVPARTIAPSGQGIRFGSGSMHTSSIDYDDDHMKDIWLDNDPRHEQRWKDANKDADRLLAAARKKGLDPQATAFMIASPAKLLQVAARGLPNMPHDWLHGMNLYDLAQNEKEGIGHILELVLNTKPSIAYLLNVNTPLETRFVIAHVYGHTDFFKRNRFFKDTRPEDILNIVGRHKTEMKRYVSDLSIPRDPRTRSNPVKEFQNKLHSISHLIDMDAEDHPLNDFEVNQYVPPVHPEERVMHKGKPPVEEKDRYLYSAEERAKLQEEFQKENLPKKRKFPAGVDRDLMGFLAKHSPGLATWQRRMLQMKREQEYYFLAQRQTKIMNEGWASFWHTKLLIEDAETNYDNTTEFEILNKKILKPNGMNPYWLGFSVWQDLYIKAGLGLPLMESTPGKYSKETMFTIIKRPEFNEERAMARLYEVCEKERDYSFIERYLTPSLVEKMKFYKVKIGEEPGFYSNYKQFAIEKQKAYEQIHKKILDLLYYCGNPVLEVVDGDFGDNGELLINHSYINDGLNVDDTKKTLKVVSSIWGRTTHLDTYLPKDKPGGQLVPIRYTADPKTGSITTHLREDRKATKTVTVESNGTVKVPNENVYSGGIW